MEFDIKTIHHKTQEPVLCECKAHEDKIDTVDILKFFGKLCHERSKNTKLKGLFFSLSGFKGTAQENYNELSNNDKEIFKIFNNDDILDLLHSLGLFSSEAEIEKTISSLTDYELGERYFSYFNSNLFTIQLLKIGGVERNYVILTGKGELVEESIRTEISQLDKRLRNLKEIDLKILEKIMINLLDNTEKNIKEVATIINEKENDVQVALNELVIQGIISKNDISNTFKLIQNIEILGKILHRLGEKKYQLIKTNFLNSLINQEFLDFVSGRFKVKLNSELNEQLKKICKLFPTVIEMLILEYNSDFQNYYNQKASKELDKGAYAELNDKLKDRLIEKILSLVVDEVEKGKNSIEKAGIRAFFTKKEIRITSDSEKIVDLKSSSTIYLAIAGGTIKPGEEVESNIPGIFNVAISCMNLELYESAIKYFDKVIDINEIEYYTILAWFNKGITNMKMKKYQSAIECFNKIKDNIHLTDFIDRNVQESINNLTQQLTDTENEIHNMIHEKNEITSFLNSIKTS